MVQSNISCESRGDVKWGHGQTLFNQFLKNVVATWDAGNSISSSLPLSFESDGSRSVTFEFGATTFS